MFRLGVTGGIGSGKSTICKVFEVFGIPYFPADDSAREIMDSDINLKKSLCQLIDSDIYKGGILDRKRLAEFIFNDKLLLEKVNNLVHPYIFEEFDNWCDRQNTPYVILDAAILYESGGEKYTNCVAAVVAPLEERIGRVIERNIMTREEVIARIKNQISESELLSRAQYVIDNSDSKMIIPQVLQIHNEILSKSRI
jgi:dephospho-CoA kinase